MKFDLRRTQVVLHELGDPQDRYPAVHVAGTNGKGSVTAMMAHALAWPDRRVGMYTSPHLSRLNERFQINGKQISDRDLARLVRFLWKAPHGKKLTQFEFLTVLAFLWFAEKNIDLAVVETGLGGRLDATNVLKNTILSVITNVDLDHTEWLGSTVAEIAHEKAGIIKPGTPVMTGCTGEALKVVQARCRRLNSDLHGPFLLGKKFKLTLAGAHQQFNARLAYESLRLLSRKYSFLTEKWIRASLERTRWPGRFESFMIRSGKNKMRVLLDGAHNPAAMKTLVRTLHESGINSVNLLFGVLKDKDFVTMIKVLSPVVRRCVTVPVPSTRTAPAALLARQSAWKNRAVSCSSIQEGWKKLLEGAPLRPVLVTGSLYLVGAIRGNYVHQTRH